MKIFVPIVIFSFPVESYTIDNVKLMLKLSSLIMEFFRKKTSDIAILAGIYDTNGILVDISNG